MRDIYAKIVKIFKRLISTAIRRIMFLFHSLCGRFPNTPERELRVG